MIEFLSLVGFILSFGAVALYRNQWVYSQRRKIYETDREEYELLPSHFAMFVKFWIWDVEEFK